MASPGAGAAAGGVDEDAVVGAFGGSAVEYGGVAESGALESGLELSDGGGAGVVGGDFAAGLEGFGELESFASGSGAGVEPVSCRAVFEELEEDLGGYVLDLDEAF